MFEDLVKEAVKKAGDAILSVYKPSSQAQSKDPAGSLHSVEMTKTNKADGSPLTIADKMSHDILVEALESTGLPVVSEEGDNLHLDQSDYWLIDPLDGTKDFLAQNDHFTINVALMRDNKPVMGVILAPALDEWYTSFDVVSVPAYVPGTPLRMAVSNFHDCENTGKFAQRNGITEKIPMGSSLKFGRMAHGLVDIYPRFVGTYEWDTAAGHAVLEAHGCQLLSMDTMKPLLYGKGSERRNGGFVAIGQGVKNVYLR